MDKQPKVRRFFYKVEADDVSDLVTDNISIGMVSENRDDPGICVIGGAEGVRLQSMGERIVGYMNPSADHPCELWGHCCALDHVALCRVIDAVAIEGAVCGSEVAGFPPVTFDIIQMSKHLDIKFPRFEMEAGDSEIERYRSLLLRAMWIRASFYFLNISAIERHNAAKEKGNV